MDHVRDRIEARFMFGGDFWSELVANLVGALIGAMLAIPTGLWLDRRIKTREQMERVRIVLQAVYNELTSNRASLKDYLEQEHVEDEIAYPVLTSGAWQAAQGLEILSVPEYYKLHEMLIGVYERIGFVSHVAQALWSLFFSANTEFGIFDRKVKILTTVLRDEAHKTILVIDQILVELRQQLEYRDV